MKEVSYDCVVVGGGISGMETALTLGDMGRRVLLVEKESTIGGKMILLSKVFPTLDCSSCISTPKMAATANHPNVTLSVYSSVKEVQRQEDGSFLLRVVRRPTYVDPSRCTGCSQCEKVCTVARPDQFNDSLVARRAIYIPFAQAVPKKAVIEKSGLSPCSSFCPAGVKAHAFVSLVRAGRYEEAYRRHMEDAPLVGVLSRVCYAPCESRCTKGKKEGTPVAIRAVKRFMVDRHHRLHPGPLKRELPAVTGKRVAVVGSGPAGLAAAYFLALRGHKVTVFEEEKELGGFLRYGIPQWRLPRPLLDRDIEEIASLGVEFNVGREIGSVASLKQEGFEGVFVAIGAHSAKKLDVPGEGLHGVFACTDFMSKAAKGNERFLEGKDMAVIGGGNVALDCARTALRLGAARVKVLYRRDVEHMPAYPWERRQALEEGVEIMPRTVVTGFQGTEQGLTGCSITQVDLGTHDDTGRPAPLVGNAPVTGFACDVAIVAIGLGVEPHPFGEELKLTREGYIEVDGETMATGIPGVYAGGDAVSGPFMVAGAVGHAKRAAFFLDQHLMSQSKGGQPAAGFEASPGLRFKQASKAKGGITTEPSGGPALDPVSRTRDNGEILSTLDEEGVVQAASRCLDCGVCCECYQCVEACPAGAVDFYMKSEELHVRAGAVVVATGFGLFDPAAKPLLGYSRAPNVITAMQMDRLLAPTRPYNGVLRPSDGKIPGNIAIVLCAGSRDQTGGTTWCSRICCMYSIKQAQLIMGALPIADVTIYYIDIRAFGKGYEEFFRQAQGMGVNFVKGKVARIEETKNQDLFVYYEDMGRKGGRKRARHDLVVLAVGAMANPSLAKAFGGEVQLLGPQDYFKEVDSALEPGATSVPGVFVAGSASGPRDIPDCVVHAGACAAQVASYLKATGDR